MLLHFIVSLNSTALLTAHFCVCVGVRFHLLQEEVVHAAEVMGWREDVQCVVLPLGGFQSNAADLHTATSPHFRRWLLVLFTVPDALRGRLLQVRTVRRRQVFWDTKKSSSWRPLTIMVCVLADLFKITTCFRWFTSARLLFFGQFFLSLLGFTPKSHLPSPPAERQTQQLKMITFYTLSQSSVTANTSIKHYLHMSLVSS